MRRRSYFRVPRRPPPFSTEEVLTEYLNYFAGWGLRLRERASLNVQGILENPTVRVIGQTSGSFNAGLTLYRARLDKGYSMTDCISMEAMRAQGITDVLDERCAL
jgi:predicted nucleic acid-binding protein